MSFLGYLINGISLGSVYAIIALGYTMVYGIAKMLNFAHGDVIMVGAFVIYTAMSSLGLSPILSVILAMVLCTILGMTIEKIAYRPLRGASPLAVLITAIGVSYLLQSSAQMIFGSAPKMVTVADLGSISFSGLTIPVYVLVTLVCSVIIMILFTLIPISCAAPLSSETAIIARPVLVYLTKRVSAVIITTEQARVTRT